MAEVIDIPGISMLTEPSDYEKLGYDRRHSTGKIMIPPRIRAKVLSRYLKEPAGSCHDNCKLGHKHELKPPIPVRVTRASKAETSPKPSSARNSQKVDGISKTGEMKSESHDLELDATVPLGSDRSGIVPDASSELQNLNHAEMAESGVADKEIMMESCNHNLQEANDSIVKVVQIHGKCKNLEAPTSSSDERRKISVNRQNSSSDTCAQEARRTQIMVGPSKMSTSNHKGLTIRVADEQSESEIDLQPSESKAPEGDVTAAVIEKEYERDPETKPDEKNMKKKKKKRANYNKPVSHSKSQQSSDQIPKKPNVPRRNGRGSTARTSTPVYIPKHASVRDGEKASSPTNSEELAGSTNKDETVLNKQMRITIISNKGNQVVPSVSSQKLDNRVPGVKAKCGNLRKVARSEGNSNNVKVETKNLKGIYRLKNQGAVKDDTDDGCGSYPPEKTLHMIETEPENKFIPSDSNNAHGNIMPMSSSTSEAKSFEKNNNRVCTGRSPPHSEKNVKRKAAYASATSSSSSKNMSHIRIRDGTHNRRLSSSTLFSVESSVTSLCSASSEHKKAHIDGRTRRMKTSIYNHTKGRQNVLRDKQTGKMMRFRRGKVIDLQPVECTPKRLNFRKRVLQDQGTADSQHKGDIGNKIAEKKIYVPKGTISGSNSEEVHLRHQNMEMKDKSASLLNNVIEQTTSKLVKTRSKVKALVTAFEAVISLQDINPSASTTEN